MAEDDWEELRPGKRQALWTQSVSIVHDKVEYEVKRVMRLVERTTQPDGQFLLEPDYELEGWWTRLQAHATHEQFYSEIKTDLDLERLPSGKFATNDLIDASIITRENIALCCCSCNASKGQKQLSVWLQTKYCKERGITPETVAPIVKRAIGNGL